MSTFTCSNGHQSTDPEWCDTCGAPIGVAPVPASGGAHRVSTADPSSAVAPVSCPHCGSMNAADNLFCESCGYDFTTGQAPQAVPGVAGSSPASPAEPPSWIVVVEVDPVWFGVKGELADRPLPAPSTSTVPIVGHASLIGRSSQSRSVRPEIALDTDSAVSRRHAQLIVEGGKLSVVDLSSTNGTYVTDAGAAPTDSLEPLASGMPAVLDDGDQIFLGAWTRLTVRHI